MEWNDIPITWQNFLNNLMQDISYNIQGCKRASTKYIAYLKLVLPLGPVERSTIGSTCMFGVVWITETVFVTRILSYPRRDLDRFNYYIKSNYCSRTLASF